MHKTINEPGLVCILFLPSRVPAEMCTIDLPSLKKKPFSFFLLLSFFFSLLVSICLLFPNHMNSFPFAFSSLYFSNAYLIRKRLVINRQEHQWSCISQLNHTGESKVFFLKEHSPRCVCVGHHMLPLYSSCL